MWFDDLGPVGAAVLTDWGDSWQGDALAVPDTIDLGVVWSALIAAADLTDSPALEVPASEDDSEMLALLAGSGFTATDEWSGTSWMDAASRPAVAPAAEGFRVVARTARPDRPHPMRARNGNEVEARLQQCSLYDPELDLGVETAEGDSAGYALFWFDDVTQVGMLEPMRVEDQYHRRGLARALLTEGLERLAHKGARRLKVSFEGEAGRNLYVGAGFSPTSSVRAFRKSRA